MKTKENLIRQQKELIELVPAFETVNAKRNELVESGSYGGGALNKARNELLDYMETIAGRYILQSIGADYGLKQVKKLLKEFSEANYHFDIEAVIGLRHSLIDPQRKLINRPGIGELYTLEHYQEFAKQVMNVKG